MSIDLMIFDSVGLAEFSPKNSQILNSFNKYVGANQKEDVPTESVRKFIDEVERSYSHIDQSNSPWAMWPPIINANGRHCTFNLTLGADFSNITIRFYNLAKEFNLILIDPQGNNPLISLPWGGGLLD